MGWFCSVSQKSSISSDRLVQQRHVFLAPRVTSGWLDLISAAVDEWSLQVVTVYLKHLLCV